MASPTEPVRIPTGDGTAPSIAVNGAATDNTFTATSKPKKASLISRIVNKLKAILKERKKKVPTATGENRTDSPTFVNNASESAPSSAQAQHGGTLV